MALNIISGFLPKPGAGMHKIGKRLKENVDTNESQEFQKTFSYEVLDRKVQL